MAELIGHSAQTAQFLNVLHAGKLPHGWILAGPKGLGKASFAKQIGQYLLEGQMPDRLDIGEFAINPASQAGHLIAAGAHPDWRLIERLAKTDKDAKALESAGSAGDSEQLLKRNIAIDQIRALQPLFNSRSSFSRFRVVIIDAADDLEGPAANALLKNLEEPPSDCLFFLISHVPDRLLPTIRSRCRLLRFDPLSDQDMTEILSLKRPDLTAVERDALIAVTQGSPGRALGYAEAGLAELVAKARTLMQRGDADMAIRLELVGQLSGKNGVKRQRAFLDIVPGLISREVKALSGERQSKAIQIWEDACRLVGNAQPKSLDMPSVIFALGGLMASLAPPKDYR